MDSIDFSDPLVIAGGAIIAIILVLVAYFALSGSSSSSAPADSTFLWSPETTFTHDTTQAIIVGAVNGDPVYVAAAPTAAGGVTLGKATSKSLWYYDGGEKKIPIAQGWLLPASALGGTPSWSATLTRGVALMSDPSKKVCRVKVSNGIHPGYATGGLGYISLGGGLQSSQTFEYLNW